MKIIFIYNKYFNRYFLTWESFRPSFSANFLRSGLLMYFCIWNLFSRPRLWRSEKTALLIIPRRGFPRAFVAHGNTRPVPVKSPSPPWIAPGNAVPPPGAPGWWPPVPEPATTDYIRFTFRKIALRHDFYFKCWDCSYKLQKRIYRSIQHIRSYKNYRYIKTTFYRF